MSSTLVTVAQNPPIPISLHTGSVRFFFCWAPHISQGWFAMTATARISSALFRTTMMEITGRQAVLVLWEHNAVCRDEPWGATIWSFRLLLCVEESPPCSPSSLHRVLMPGFMEVRLNTNINVMPLLVKPWARIHEGKVKGREEIFRTFWAKRANG